MTEEPKTLLLVDDNEDSLDVLARLLERKGYVVLRATGGREALDVVARERVDLIVLDVMMPEVTGLDVLRELRLTRSPAELPVIIATAQTESRDVVRALDLGANDHVTKPVDVDVLVARVRSQLRQRDSLRAAVALSTPAHGLGAVLAAKYELKEKLGTGGFGQVYRARHVTLDTFVAVKVLHSHLLDSEETRARFAREGISACRVRHPNAVVVLDAGTTEQGAPYLVMELLEGPSLFDALSREKVLRVRRVAEVAVPVCEVLQAAHAAGVIHRDIKPANILLAGTQRGEVVKVLDFGIAKLVDEVLDSPVTAGGQVVGTPHYMAPERLSGGDADEPSDVYSVGAMLYQMLCGRLPYGDAAATPLAQALRQLRGNAAPVAQVRPDLPRALADAVMRCLEPDPAARPTLAELAETLRSAGAEHVEHTWPPELHEDAAQAEELASKASGTDTTVAGVGGRPASEDELPGKDEAAAGSVKAKGDAE